MARNLRPTMFDKLDFERYSFREYPKMLYGKGGKTTVVKSEGEETALQGEWFTSPADALKG